MPSKRRKKNADGSEEYRDVAPETSSKTTVKKKATPKKPVVFKAGKWNPDTELVEFEMEKFGHSSDIDYSCCKLCNLRNLHRAVNRGDAVMLKELVCDKKNITHFMAPFSHGSNENILAKIFEQNSLPML